MKITRRMLLGATLAGGAAALGPVVLAASDLAGDYRVSGPYQHGQLAVYLLHGSEPPGAGGPAPLTLEEAVRGGLASLQETGVFEKVAVVNDSGHELFLQASDLIKGGWQDRVVAVTTVVPPNSRIVSN